MDNRTKFLRVAEALGFHVEDCNSNDLDANTTTLLRWRHRDGTVVDYHVVHGVSGNRLVKSLLRVTAGEPNIKLAIFEEDSKGKGADYESILLAVSTFLNNELFHRIGAQGH